MDSNPNVYDILILGGGISGLGAGRTLLKSGIKNFLIVEGKGNIGGRVLCTKFGNGIIEVGGGWIHGQNNQLYNLIQQCNNLSDIISEEGKGIFAYAGGNEVNIGLVHKVLSWINDNLDELDANSDAISIESYLKNKFSIYLEQSEDNQTDLKSVFDWAVRFLAIDNGCKDLNELSCISWSDFKINDGVQYNNFKNGSDQFLQAAFSDLNQFLVLNAPVTKIHWQNDNTDYITVYLEDGRTYKTLSVIVTFSIGVLKATADDLFQPNLPKYFRESLDSIGFGPITKVFCEWESPWWEVNFQGIQFLWSEEEKLEKDWRNGLTGFDPIQSNSNVLIGWVGGIEAEEVETLEVSKVGIDVGEILSRFFAKPIPAPVNTYVSKWNTDRFTRGGYSYRSTIGDGTENIAELISTPVESNNGKCCLAFCGEGCSKDEYSTIHGAYSNGIKQAQQIIKFLNTKDDTNTS